MLFVAIDGTHERSASDCMQAAPCKQHHDASTPCKQHHASTLSHLLQDDAEWGTLKPLVFAAIMDHYGSGEPVISDEASLAASDTAIHEDDDEVGLSVVLMLYT